jgi:hypothetical protein
MIRTGSPAVKVNTCRAGLVPVALAVASSLAGCASSKADYQLAGREPAALAVIYGDKRTPLVHIREAGATVCKIDGKNITNPFAFGTCEEGPLYVEPGVHSFEVKAYIGAATRTLNVSFELLAGHQYFFDATGSFTGANSATGTFWVEDRTAGAVVYGQRPSVRQW